MTEDASGTSRRPIPAGLAAGLVAAIVLDTILQVLWKQSALSLPAGVAPLATAAAIWRQPLFLGVGVLFAAQMINWLKVLDAADVSYALPVTALSYVSVALVSSAFLHEHLTPGRMAGIALILGGVVLVSRTDHHTAGDEA